MASMRKAEVGSRLEAIWARLRAELAEQHVAYDLLQSVEADGRTIKECVAQTDVLPLLARFYEQLMSFRALSSGVEMSMAAAEVTRIKIDAPDKHAELFAALTAAEEAATSLVPPAALERTLSPTEVVVDRIKNDVLALAGLEESAELPRLHSSAVRNRIDSLRTALSRQPLWREKTKLEHTVEDAARIEAAVRLSCAKKGVGEEHVERILAGKRSGVAAAIAALPRAREQAEALPLAKALSAYEEQWERMREDSGLAAAEAARLAVTGGAQSMLSGAVFETLVCEIGLPFLTQQLSLPDGCFEVWENVPIFAQRVGKRGKSRWVPSGEADFIVLAKKLEEGGEGAADGDASKADGAEGAEEHGKACEEAERDVALPRTEEKGDAIMADWRVVALVEAKRDVEDLGGAFKQWSADKLTKLADGQLIVRRKVAGSRRWQQLPKQAWAELRFDDYGTNNLLYFATADKESLWGLDSSAYNWLMAAAWAYTEEELRLPAVQASLLVGCAMRLKSSISTSALLQLYADAGRLHHLLILPADIDSEADTKEEREGE
eukprot:PLAT11059.1.p1 GENE.PLAT11059.1~~PLAT11059.1.p1  ORF type:complete len:551 (-),score=212.61 PLAT11059.1:209-1861(-)